MRQYALPLGTCYLIMAGAFILPHQQNRRAKMASLVVPPSSKNPPTGQVVGGFSFSERVGRLDSSLCTDSFALFLARRLISPLQQRRIVRHELKGFGVLVRLPIAREFDDCAYGVKHDQTY